jgi:undecaprenyl-diphosphatase
MHLPTWLHELDTKLELAINGAHHPSFDIIFFYASNKWVWIPFYGWLFYLLYKTYQKKILFFLPMIAGMIAISDQLSTLLKNTTQRLRPCHEPALQDFIHRLNNACGGSFGFVSSHAANTMALAVFISLCLPASPKFLKGFLIFFVLINGYSRMYLGAHYPLDILCGWMLGFILAIICSSLMPYLVKTSNKIAS